MVCGSSVAQTVQAPASQLKAETHETTQSRARTALRKGTEAYDAEDYVAAIALFEEAYSIKPSPILEKHIARATFRLGAEAYYAKDYATASALFEEAHTIRPAPLLLFYKARCYAELGDLEQALDHMEQYSATGPEAEKEIVPLLQKVSDTLSGHRTR